MKYFFAVSLLRSHSAAVDYTSSLSLQRRNPTVQNTSGSRCVTAHFLSKVIIFIRLHFQSDATLRVPKVQIMCIWYGIQTGEVNLPTNAFFQSNCYEVGQALQTVGKNPIQTNKEIVACWHCKMGGWYIILGGGEVPESDHVIIMIACFWVYFL